ncbi:MAG: S8 family serine peptidase [Candidatus Cloacimonetes bacterium]|nr:S8 family serine peptidase [Candidatus Cloacimonadota bacterium]
MKNFKSIFISIVFLLIYTFSFAFVWVSGELIVELKDNDTVGFLSKYSTYEMIEKEHLSVDFNLWIFSHNDDIISSMDLLSIVRFDENVKSVSLNYYTDRYLDEPDFFEIPLVNPPIDPDGPNDTYFYWQWALKNRGLAFHGVDGVIGADISANGAWGLLESLPDINSREIYVAIADIGYDFENVHDDLEWYIPSTLTIIPTSPAEGGTIHATRVGGIVSAKGNNAIGVSGLGGGIVDIIPIALNNDNDHLQYVLDQRRLYNTTNGAEGKFIVAVNYSWSGYENFLRFQHAPRDTTRYRIISELNDAGVLFIWGAGNSPSGQPGIYNPYDASLSTCPQNIIGVAGTTHTDELWDRSAWGEKSVHLAAPARATWTTDIVNGYIETSGGTSIAAPHVVGVIALMYHAASDELLDVYSKFPQELALTMKNFLLSGVDILPNLIDKTISGGRLNAYNAVNNVINYHPIALNITDNTSISNQTIILDKFYVINNSATLTITNCHIKSSNTERTYGFDVRSGSLIFENCTFDMQDWDFLRVSGTGNSISIVNSTYNQNRMGRVAVFQGANFSMLKSRLNFYDGRIQVSGYHSRFDLLPNSNITFTDGRIDIQNNAIMSLSSSLLNLYNLSTFRLSDFSSLEVDNASGIGFLGPEFTGVSIRPPSLRLELTGKSRVSVFAQSSFYTSGYVDIRGETSSGLFRGDFDYSEISPFNYNYDIPGDHIYIAESHVEMWAGLLITNMTDQPAAGRWDGITIINSRPEITGYQYPSLIYGDPNHDIIVSNIHFFQIINSEMDINYFRMNRCGRMNIVNNSQVNMVNFHYGVSSEGLFVGGGNSSIKITNPNTTSYQIVLNQNSSGISFHHTTGNNILDGVWIANNAGSGIELISAKVTVRNSTIQNNNQWGISSLSQSSSIISSNTKIHSNGFAETVAMGDAFMIFSLDQPNDPKPHIYDNNPPLVAPDQYLLMALGQIHPRGVDLGQLNIAMSDSTRFYPSRRSFRDRMSTQRPAVLFEEAISLILNSEYEEAYAQMRMIVTDYPETEHARMALHQLPSLVSATRGDYVELMDFLSQQQNQNLVLASQNVHAQIMVTLQIFNEAILMYEILLQDPPDEITQLHYELQQAYSYFMSVIFGSRSQPEVSRHKPRTYQEYSEIKNNLLSLMFDIEETNKENDIPEFYELSLSNIPNPFNPETRILFTVPKDGVVSIDIFNIRGQRVRNLMKEEFSAGQYEIIWNGTSDNGRQVASGVYFYRLQAGGESITRRMVLLK